MYFYVPFCFSTKASSAWTLFSSLDFCTLKLALNEEDALFGLRGFALTGRDLAFISLAGFV
jgi:hypothetical protein